MKKLTALLILDGFGHSDETCGNAISIANAENISSLLNSYPSTLISASGKDVGLPEGQMGNSEVGHLNIGAGRVVYQDLSRISNALDDGSFYTNPAFLDAINNCKQNNSALHVYGLCSDGGVHSRLAHLYAIIKLAKKHNLNNVFVHCFLDGRDVPPDSGADYVLQIQTELKAIECGKIASVMGRYYAMDRDNRYDRIQAAYDAMVCGVGIMHSDPVAAIRESYQNGVTDEFVVPTVITDCNNNPVGQICANDSIIFFNFRSDRAREITRAFVFSDFPQLVRKSGKLPVYYVCMTQYGNEFDGMVDVAFAPQRHVNTLGEYLSKQGLLQLRIAETEKYAHVTFFFNGGVEEANPREDRVLIPSPKDVATYDLKPEMSAFEVTSKAVELVNSGKYDFMVINFANPDMVGHTGVLDAAVKAVKTVDACVKQLVDAILENDGRCLLTADHGNCECMIGSEGEAFTAHTANPVPLAYIASDAKRYSFAPGGRLCDIAPTLLFIMGLAKPSEMTGVSLLKLNAERIQ